MVSSKHHKFRVDADVVKRAMVEQGYSGRTLAAEIGCNRFSLSRGAQWKRAVPDHFDVAGNRSRP